MNKYNSKVKYLFHCIFLFIVIGCQKQSQTPVLPLEPFSEQEEPIKKIMDGLFLRRTFQDVNDDTITPMKIYYANVWFKNHEDPDTNYLKADSISLNKIYLKLGGWQYYSDYIPYYPELSWHVKGNAVVPDVDYTDKSGIPTFDGYADLPDFIDISKPIKIAIKGIKNTTHITLNIWDDVNLCASGTSLPITGSDVVLTSSYKPHASPGIIEIVLDHNNMQPFGNKKFNFCNQNIIRKEIVFY